MGVPIIGTYIKNDQQTSRGSVLNGMIGIICMIRCNSSALTYRLSLHYSRATALNLALQ